MLRLGYFSDHAMISRSFWFYLTWRQFLMMLVVWGVALLQKKISAYRRLSGVTAWQRSVCIITPTESLRPESHYCTKFLRSTSWQIFERLTHQLRRPGDVFVHCWVTCLHVFFAAPLLWRPLLTSLGISVSLQSCSNFFQNLK